MSLRRGTGVGGETAAAKPAYERWSLPAQRVIRRALRDDPAHEYFVYLPGAARAEVPLLVGVHGISRNADELAHLFAPLCDRFQVALVAPHFSHGHSRDYQRLGRAGRGPRADLALHSILDEVALLTGADAARIHLFGFSGGAQFAHRYVMAHPHRVAVAVVAAAGWYTFPEARRRYPYGIRRSRDLADVRFDPEEFLRVPITVMVGDRDTSAEDLRSTRRVMRQGRDRVERARKWVEAMQAAATAFGLEPLVRFEPIPGGDHSFKSLMEGGRLGERVFTALFGPARAQADGDGNG